MAKPVESGETPVPANLQSDLELEGKPGHRVLRGGWAIAATWVGVAMALYHLYFLGLTTLTPYLLRAGHLSFTGLLLFGLLKGRPGSPSHRVSLPDLLAGLFLVANTVYIIAFFDDLQFRVKNFPEPMDLAFAIATILLVLEGTRRATGWVLPAIAVFSIFYGIFGQFVPGMLGHRGFEYERVIGTAYSVSGVFGLPLGVSATYIYLFILFGAFLQGFGGGKFFLDLASSLFGKVRGGPAKIGVVASAFFGTISGSAVANVVGTGTFTIPQMIRLGYRPAFAGAVEAVASAGGQIMPPVMGAGVFVMADIIQIPYIDIATAAAFPAILYFLAVFLMVDLEAVKSGMQGMRREELPPLGRVMLESGYLLIPIITLLYWLIYLRTSPIRAALVSLLATLLVTLAVALPEVWRKIRGKFADAKIFLGNSSSRLELLGLRNLSQTLALGSQNCLEVSMASACAGIIVSIIELSGLGIKLALFIIEMSGGIPLLALIYAMAISLILGMGLPTTPAYIINAAVVAPALIQIGITPLPAHLFVFYFSCIAVITPPVCMAAFAGAGIARANPMAVAATACKLGIVAFIIPFMFVYAPSLLLEGSWAWILLAVATATTGVWALASGLQGWAFGPVSMWQRACLIASAFVLIYPGVITDVTGLLLIAAALLPQWRGRAR